MKSKNILIKVNQLYKIFGDGDKSALDLVKNGMGKDELLEKSNCVLGLMNGLAIVILAIIFDRVTQKFGLRMQKYRNEGKD